MAAASAQAQRTYWEGVYNRERGRMASQAQMLWPTHFRSPGAIIGKKVLDVGCGTDPEMLRRAKEFVGIDFALPALRIAKSQVKGEKAEFAKGDALKLPFRDDSFDTVVSFRVMTIQGANLPKALEEMKRVARETVIFTLYSVEHALRHGAKHGIQINFGTLYEGKDMNRITMTSDQVRALLRAHTLRPRQIMFLQTGELYVEAEKAKPTL